MRTIRIYQAGAYEPGQTITLSDAAGQHVGTVLRMHPGEQLTLFRGDNLEFTTTILAIHKRQVTVNIIAVASINRESPRAIHLAQAISKGDRMEWIIQKAVELGIQSITPLITTHCVVRVDAERLLKKQAQWQAIAIAACEQSGRNQIPMIHPCSPLDDYLNQCQTKFKLMLHPQAPQRWRDMTLGTGDITLLIGPEGGFTNHEINLAKQHQFEALQLGPRILRTETAAITAISLLQAMFGDL